MDEKTNVKRVWFALDINREQSRDAGLALVLILLLAGFFTDNVLFFELAIPVVLMVMVVPGWFFPFAVCWYGISHLLGSFMSQVLLGLVFYALVCPVAFIRRVAGSDNLRLRMFRRGKTSVMHVRNHRYLPEDLEKPF